MWPTNLQDYTAFISSWEDIYIPELLPDVLATIADYADWECELTIAAEAVYAENFLSPN